MFKVFFTLTAVKDAEAIRAMSREKVAESVPGAASVEEKIDKLYKKLLLE